VIATATHGSGLALGVMSTHVLALELMLPDGRVVPCSRADEPELFAASLCGLGATGLILSATLEVVPAFRLQEHQRSFPFDEAVALIPELAPGAEHFRAWWFPQADTVRLSMANATTEVSCARVRSGRGGADVLQPIKPAGSWLWDSLCGYHVIQFMLFIGRFIPAVTTWTARFAAWLVSAPSVGVNTAMKIFNVDCRYRQVRAAAPIVPSA
jgi:L-gulonolactone oxidase